MKVRRRLRHYVGTCHLVMTFLVVLSWLSVAVESVNKQHQVTVEHLRDTHKFVFARETAISYIMREF